MVEQEDGETDQVDGEDRRQVERGVELLPDEVCLYVAVILQAGLLPRLAHVLPQVAQGLHRHRQQSINILLMVVTIECEIWTKTECRT